MKKKNKNIDFPMNYFKNKNAFHPINLSIARKNSISDKLLPLRQSFLRYYTKSYKNNVS